MSQCYSGSEQDLNYPVIISLELPYCWSGILEGAHCHNPTAVVNNYWVVCECVSVGWGHPLSIGASVHPIPLEVELKSVSGFPDG